MFSRPTDLILIELLFSESVKSGGYMYPSLFTSPSGDSCILFSGQLSEITFPEVYFFCNVDAIFSSFTVQNYLKRYLGTKP